MKKIIASILFTVLTSLAWAQTQENLKIVWPEEYKWKIGSNQEDETMHQMELIPGNQEMGSWKIMGSMMSIKNTQTKSTAQILEVFKDAALKESPSAKLTELEKNDKGKNPWVLFKVETPSFPNDPTPESQLYYVIQGKATLYSNFVAIKEKK